MLSPLALARRGNPRSVFRPPEVPLRSVPPRKATQSLTAAATPWMPPAASAGGSSTTAAPRPATAPSNGNGPKPPAPLHSSPPLQPAAAPASVAMPPTALGNSPSLQPQALSKSALPPPVSIEALSSLPSPLLCPPPESPGFGVFTEEAMESGVYTYEMLQALRKDCAHTPRRVLNWVIQMYRTTPSLKVPAHLVLTIDEPLVEEDGMELGDRSPFGGFSRSATSRRRPMRQVHHKVMSVLSRVTPQKYTELQKELMELPLKQTTDAELKEVVRVFFEKAVQEPTFSALYANLVADICRTTEAERELEKEQKEKLLASRMRRELLLTCQEEFQRPVQLTEDDKVDPITGKPLEAEEIDAKRDRMKKRLCGNIKFVGELYKKKLVTERVVGQIMELLVGDYDPKHPNRKEEYVFEVFQTLFKCVGVVCKDTNPDMMNKFLAIGKIIQGHPTPRIRFLMMDLEDLAKRNWATKDRLLTMEERERETIEEQRRGYEEIERRARARQQEIDEYVLSGAVQQQQQPQLSTPTMAPNRGAQFSTGLRPPALNQAQLAQRTQGSTQDLKHPHGTPTASPAKPNMGRLGGFSVSGPGSHSGSSNNLMMTPPPKYQRNPPVSSVERSPVVHPSAGLNVPHVLSGNMLSDSLQTSGMSRTQSTASLSSTGFPGTPLSPNAPPMPLNDLANALMNQYATNHKVEDVLHTLRTLSVQHRVSLLTLWMRRALTTTKFFAERDQICCLFAAIIQCASNPQQAILSAEDLATCFMEMLRYDVERGQLENCPRWFCNIGGMLIKAYDSTFPPSLSIPAPDPAAMEQVRGILNGMVFTIILRELHAHDALTVIPTLARDAQPIVQQMIALLPVASSLKQDVIFAAQNRFRILPFLLYGDGAMTRAKTPKTPGDRSSPLNDSLTGRYDAFSQCLAFPKVADDIEMCLFRRIKEVDAPVWRDFAVQLATTTPPPIPGQKDRDVATLASNPTSKLIQVMKVLGTMLAVLHPKDGMQPVLNSIRSEDLDQVVLSILGKKKNALEVQCVMVIELMAHFTYTVANITTCAVAESPSKTTLSSNHLNSSLSDANSSWSNIETRMSKMTGIFKRWVASNMIQDPAVLDLLKSIREGAPGPHPTSDEIAYASQHSGVDTLCTLQYNFVVESSWTMALQSLSN